MYSPVKWIKISLKKIAVCYVFSFLKSGESDQSLCLCDFFNLLLDVLREMCLESILLHGFKIKNKPSKRRIQMNDFLKINDQVFVQASSNLSFLYFLRKKYTPKIPWRRDLSPKRYIHYFHRSKKRPALFLAAAGNCKSTFSYS